MSQKLGVFHDDIQGFEMPRPSGDGLTVEQLADETLIVRVRYTVAQHSLKHGQALLQTAKAHAYLVDGGHENGEVRPQLYH